MVNKSKVLSPDPMGRQTKEKKMSKVKPKSKTLAAREAKEVESLARFHATCQPIGLDLTGLVKSVVNGNLKAKPKATETKVEKKDVQTRRLEFIKTKSAQILKTWGELAKPSANGLERVLPHDWPSEWVEEVLDLNGLRTSGYKSIQAAIAADKSLLKKEG